MALAVTGKQKGHVTEIYIEWWHNKARIKVLKAKKSATQAFKASVINVLDTVCHLDLFVPLFVPQHFKRICLCL